MTADGNDAGEEHLAEGTLLSHLIELRTRLIRMLLAVFVVFAILVPFSQRIFELASKPIIAVLPDSQLIATSVISPILTPFKLTFWVAFLIAMPYVLYQVWAFVAPGLYRKEKRFAFPLLASSILLFYIGVLFAYFVVFPLVFGFVAKLAANSEAYTQMTDISDYLGFITMSVFAFGLAFETPIATVLIVWTGLTTPDKLAKARPYVFLMAFVIGMFLTPPDVISQTLLALPVYLLFELGILLSRTVARSPEPESANEVK